MLGSLVAQVNSYQFVTPVVPSSPRVEDRLRDRVAIFSAILHSYPMNVLQKFTIGLFAWLVLGSIVGIAAGIETGGKAWFALAGVPLGLLMLIVFITLAGLVVSLAIALLLPQR